MTQAALSNQTAESYISDYLARCTMNGGAVVNYVEWRSFESHMYDGEIPMIRVEITVGYDDGFNDEMTWDVWLETCDGETFLYGEC